MTFPTIEASEISRHTGNVTVHSIDLPATVNSGEAIILLSSTSGNDTNTTPTGYTLVHFKLETNATMYVWAKIAAGTEGGTSVTYTSGSGQASAHIAITVDNWSGVIADIESSATTAIGASTDPDPVTVTASWGSDDNMFLALSAIRKINSVSSFPTNYNSNQIESLGLFDGGGSTCIMCTRNLVSATDDPGIFTLADISGWSAATLVIKPDTPALGITSITPDPAETGAALTIAGSLFEASQGTGGVTQEQGAVVVALTETAWADTEITATSATIESTGLKYGTQTLEVVNDSAEETTETFVADPATEHSYIDIGTPATAGDRITAVGDLTTGDQLRYENLLQQGGSPTIYTVTVDNTGVFQVDGTTADGSYIFECRLWDTSDQTWGAAADQTVIVGTVPLPVLSLPTAVKTGETTATGTVTSDTALGDIWGYVSLLGTPPTTANHMSGLGSAAHYTEASPTVGVNSNFSFTGLTENVTYFIHYLQNDDTSDSVQVTSSSFTTDAAPIPPSTAERLELVRDLIEDLIIDLTT